MKVHSIAAYFTYPIPSVAVKLQTEGTRKVKLRKMGLTSSLSRQQWWDGTLQYAGERQESAIIRMHVIVVCIGQLHVYQGYAPSVYYNSHKLILYQAYNHWRKRSFTHAMCW